MAKYKYLLSQFTFYDRTGICRLLEAQAEKGWLLDKITTLGWRLRRIEPQKIHYAVTYFPKASAYDPHPSEAQQELHEFCAHSGWILAGTTAQMQVFYNLSENPVPIETDPLLELENIHRSAKRNYLPAYFMLFILAVMQIALQVGQLLSFPLTYLSQDTTLFNWLCELILLGMCAMEISGYFSWYRRAKPAAENGEFVETRGFRRVQLFLLGVVLVALGCLLISMQPRMAVMMITVLTLMALVLLTVWGSHGLMKKKGVSRNTNRLVTWVLSIVLAMAVCGLSVTVLSEVFALPVWDNGRVVEQYEWNGLKFDIYKDEIPLRVEDLTDVKSPDYSYEAREQGSVFLKRGEYSQRIWGSSDLPELSYIVYSTQVPAIYDLCVREAIKPEDYPMGADIYGNLFYETYIHQEAELWGANYVYRRYIQGEPYNDYVLCYEGHIVILHPNWELTQAQMSIVGEMLGK